MASVSLPYLVAPGSLKTGLERIQSAATPDRVSKDFIATKLQVKGGTGSALIPFLKKIGFVASDGAPTELYKKFRNTSTASSAAAQAVKLGYGPLAEVNEYFYDLNDKDLMSLILQVTGAEKDNQVAKYTLSTLKNLKAFANFDGAEKIEDTAAPANNNKEANAAAPDLPQVNKRDKIGMNLSYTINLNLPATTDQAVFNAIFRSLKEHLINEQ